MNPSAFGVHKFIVGGRSIAERRHPEEGGRDELDTQSGDEQIHSQFGVIVNPT